MALWTKERLQRLDRQELKQLMANAQRLAEPELAALCAETLKGLPARGPTSSGAASPGKLRIHLVPRASAFQARGVWLRDPRVSWSGIRKSDGAVVFALWAPAVESEKGGCCCLLWAPNLEGHRPWSDSTAGQERLEHCRVARESGSAEGLLVHGQAMEGRLPEDRARTVHGIDTAIVIRFMVEQRGDEYWAVWGKAA